MPGHRFLLLGCFALILPRLVYPEGLPDQISVQTVPHVDPAPFTGEKLRFEILLGKQVRERGLPLQDAKDDSEVVVTHLARPLAKGATNRIRLKETYTDPKSYYMDGEELVWDRSFGRLRNMVVLPPG